MFLLVSSMNSGFQWKIVDNPSGIKLVCDKLYGLNQLEYYRQFVVVEC